MITITTGRQSDPLHAEVLSQAVQAYQSKSSQDTFIIVPNHIKFTTEVEALTLLANQTDHDSVSVNHLHVLSFSRLAWFLLNQGQHQLKPVLDDALATMILTQIIHDKQAELILLKKNANNGLIQQLYHTIVELHEQAFDFNLPVNDLDQETRDKLHDLQLIYDEFYQRLENRFATSDEIELQLNQYLQTADLSQAAFWITDFSHFTFQQQITLGLLGARCQNLTLSFATANGQINQQPEPGDYDYVVQTTIATFLRFCQNHGLAVKTNEYSSKFDSPKALLNSYWVNGPIVKGEIDEFVQLVRADSRYAEADFVARTIYQQVATGHYRYRDFLVLAPQLSEYETYLGPILRQNAIPYFDDLQRKMKYHPLVILVENLAKIAKTGLTTEAILSIMKTHLFIPPFYETVEQYRQDVDQLENFALAHGINYQRWGQNLSAFTDAKIIPADTDQALLERLEQLRSYYLKEILQLVKQLTESTSTKDALKIFFNFLTTNQIAKRLEVWREQAQAEGDLQLARQPEQVWSLLVKLLEDYLLINPDHFNVTEFFDVLLMGFAEADFSQIPSTLDAVNLSEIGMTQQSSYKQVFIIGASSNNLPQMSSIPGYLTTENRQVINQALTADQKLEDAQLTANLSQDYQFGTALSLASERVFVSYPVTNVQNERLDSSMYYRQLANYGAKELFQHDLPSPDLHDLTWFMTSPKASIGYLTYLASKLPDNQQIKALVSDANQRLTKPVNLDPYSANPRPIGPALAKRLYGKQLLASVSQLETYYKNSFEYFLKYGLRLKKRADNSLDFIQAGNYSHESMDGLVKLAQEKQLDLATLSEQDLVSLLEQVEMGLKEKGQYRQILASSAANAFLFTELDAEGHKVALNWLHKMHKSTMRPAYSELAFGKRQPLAGLEFSVPGFADAKISLRGKIDRVDVMPNALDESVIAQVIDYKSSPHKYTPAEFFNGLSLQMMTYLDVIYRHPEFFKAKEVKLLGGYYQLIDQQVINLSSKNAYNSNFERRQDKLNTQADLRYQGVLVNDLELFQTVVPNLKPDGAEIYSAMQSTGKVNSRSAYFSPDDLITAFAYTEYLIKQAGHDILSGKVDLNPYQLGNTTALTYSDFKDIFYFDAKLDSRYHLIDSLKQQELMEKIREILEKERS